MDNVTETHEYIVSHWQKAVIAPENAASPSLYVKPFTPPCIDGPFKSLFYWDTYFTNKGLIADGRTEDAKNNVDNLLNAVKKYGFVPNALSMHLLKFCSQPPYLYLMVKDVFEATGDKKWLKKAYPRLKDEYFFWQTERMTPIGLNRYYHHRLPDYELLDYYDVVANDRLKLADEKTKEEKIALAHGFIAVAESGMDWTPRFGFCGDEIIPVDLNSHLYAFENLLFELALDFEPEKAPFFGEAAHDRKKLMDKYLKGEDGLYYDYNYVTGKRSEINCSAQFIPFFAELLNDKNAFNRLIDRLLYKNGVVSVEKTDDKIAYQWGYPNSWAPDNYLAYVAAKACGETEKAKEIADKYIDTVADAFDDTGRLWEKYDGVRGGVATVNEYDVPEMLGWTAGVFEYFLKDKAEI